MFRYTYRLYFGCRRIERRARGNFGESIIPPAAGCKFMMPGVEYLGFHISGEGIRSTQEKRQSILNAPAPCDVTQLKSAL